MKAGWRNVFLLLLFSFLVVGTYVTDRWMTRSSRLGVDECHSNMISISDALLLHEQRHGQLPERLHHLVPAYVSGRMLYCTGVEGTGTPRLRYIYSREERSIRDPAPHVLHGLWKRTAEVRSISVPIQPAISKPRAAPQLVEPPDGAIVLEAERFAWMNYGWEIKHDLKAGNGCILVNKEGVANKQAQEQGFGDYYNVGNNRAQCELYYRFRVPGAGEWFIQPRMMTSGTRRPASSVTWT